ncbi:hypothetical protein ABZ837_26015 [Streptomyces sp. NPDC047197]|uniref:hypothetical protein n=1 Tax=Streptomyces sp. NPDC047197 TaxID=3155477 RepID=UPI0033E223BA
MRGELAVYLNEFEFRFGYPPDPNSVETGSGCDEAVRDEASAVSAVSAGSATPGDLALLYRHISRLSLPDVGVGLFVHSVRQTADGLRGDLPTRVVGEVEDSVAVLGSDGGGALFALSRTDGATVYRLPPARVDGSAYRCAEGIEVVALGLRGFLVHVESELRRS